MSNGKRIVDAMHEAAQFEAIRTHARTIVEGEGAEEHDPALVEAVAQALYYREPTLQYDISYGASEMSFEDAQRHDTSEWFEAMAATQTVFSTIRKHQAGE